MKILSANYGATFISCFKKTYRVYILVDFIVYEINDKIYIN